MVTNRNERLWEDAEASLDRLTGEEILHVTGRHWILLLVELLLPLFVIVLFGGLALFRAAGGRLLVVTGQLRTDLTGLTPFDTVLAVFMVILGVLLVVSFFRKKPQRFVQGGLIGLLLLFGAVLLLRLSGAEFLTIRPLDARPFDVVNLVLWGIVILALIACWYVYYNWSNDELILTNFRVIFDNDTVLIPKILESRVQDQLPITDVQNVLAKTTNYLEQWLNYGTIIIQSATIGRSIEFGAANDPREMQQKIMRQKEAMRRLNSEQDHFAELIETRVYNTKLSPSSSHGFRARSIAAPSFLRWLMDDNPAYDEKKDQVIWRKHWFFLVQALALPVLSLLIGLLIIVFTASAGLLGGGWIVLSLVLLLLVFAGWFWWQYEDHRNDLYILSMSGVIDIEKKPFGPEDRRTASLAAIQNVSFQTTFISNLLGYGDVIFTTAGSGGAFTFLKVPRPREVVATIQEYLARYRRQERDQSLNTTLELLRQYHLAQYRHDELKSGEQPETEGR
jgi:hypothetical protein